MTRAEWAIWWCNMMTAMTARHQGKMVVTVTVEYEDNNRRNDLGIQERFTIEQIELAKFDILGETVKHLKKLIERARNEKATYG